MFSIGLMSGTSMDGIDAALLETDGSLIINEIGDISLSYDPQTRILLKAAEYAIRTAGGSMAKAESCYPQALEDYLRKELGLSKTDIQDKIKELSWYLHEQPDHPITLEAVIYLSTMLHAQAVTQLLEKTGYEASQIDVVGYHGQAMFHQPSKGISVIVGNGQDLADHLQIMVVNDFRSNDIKAGGFGAPFAPAYHQALATRDAKTPLIGVNCGGISNMTVVQSTNELDLIGFDTGPGNGLIDQFIRRRTHGAENMDVDGKYGSKGVVNDQAFAALYEKSIIKNSQNYFQMPPPKALDIGDLQLVPELDSLSIQDACRTLEAFTADTIVQSLDLLDINVPKTWILTGGGWYNPVILEELKERLTKKLGAVAIFTADQIGWNNQAMEAQIFAYLAVRSLQNKPFSFPGTTKVSHPQSGGTTYLSRPTHEKRSS